MRSWGCEELGMWGAGGVRNWGCKELGVWGAGGVV